MDSQARRDNGMAEPTASPLDHLFRVAKAMEPTDAQAVRAAIDGVRHVFPDAAVNSDWEAGDTWILIEYQGTNLVMLNGTIPLLFTHPSVAGHVRLPSGRAVIVVEEKFHARHFSIHPETVLATLNLNWPILEVDPRKFSLAELSRATG